MADTTAMTIRLPVALAENLKLIADCDNETVNEAIRIAIAWYIDSRRLDPNMQEALRARIERAKLLLPKEEA